MKIRVRGCQAVADTMRISCTDPENGIQAELDLPVSVLGGHTLGSVVMAPSAGNSQRHFALMSDATPPVPLYLVAIDTVRDCFRQKTAAVDGDALCVDLLGQRQTVATKLVEKTLLIHNQVQCNDRDIYTVWTTAHGQVLMVWRCRPNILFLRDDNNQRQIRIESTKQDGDGTVLANPVDMHVFSAAHVDDIAIFIRGMRVDAKFKVQQ